MSDLRLTLTGGPAMDPQPVTYDQWLDELLDLSLDLERHGSIGCYLIETVSGDLFVWSIWLATLVH